MPIHEALQTEIDQEAVATRRLLERVPEDKLSWRPHPKARSLGQLAFHIAQIPGGVTELAALDVAQAPSFDNEPEARSRKELLETLDGGIARAKETLSKMDDQKLMATWTLQNSGQTVLSMPRIALLRSVLLNHNYHHRGQLSVYLRILDVPIPSIYGPSADENPFSARN